MEVLGTRSIISGINCRHTHSAETILWATLYERSRPRDPYYEIIEEMHEMIQGVSSRDNFHSDLWLIRSRQEISEIFCYPNQPARPANSLRSYSSRRRSTSSPPRSSPARSQSSCHPARCTKRRRKGKFAFIRRESHLTVEPFILAGPLGGTKESPSEIFMSWLNIICLTFFHKNYDIPYFSHSWILCRHWP